jgi:hypothetical protein
MKSDMEYECCVIECAIAAFCEFMEDNDYFDYLKEDEKVEIITTAFKDSQWPRGNPSEVNTIKNRLKEMGYVEKTR